MYYTVVFICRHLRGTWRLLLCPQHPMGHSTIITTGCRYIQYVYSLTNTHIHVLLTYALHYICSITFSLIHDIECPRHPIGHSAVSGSQL